MDRPELVVSFLIIRLFAGVLRPLTKPEGRGWSCVELLAVAAVVVVVVVVVLFIVVQVQER